MNRITVYLKGVPGFKPAIVTKLGSEWIHNGRDIEDGIISFLLPKKMSMEQFKSLIDADTVSEFNVLFFDKFPIESDPTPWTFVPGRPFKMSIWTNSEIHINGSQAAKGIDEKKV